jgi:hypothetical protein
VASHHPYVQKNKSGGARLASIPNGQSSRVLRSMRSNWTNDLLGEVRLRALESLLAPNTVTGFGEVRHRTRACIPENRGKRPVKLKTVPMLLVFVAAAFLLTAQGPLPIPPTHDPDHQSQPEWCQRESGRYLANCTECAPRCNPDEEEDSNCKTYCRRGACQCHGCGE